VSLFQNDVRNLHISNTLTSAEFGNTDPDYVDYLFVTTDNSSQHVQIRGMEFEYSQSLSFLPQPFKRLSVRAAYTRNYAEVITPNLTPHAVSSGLNYSYGRFGANVNWTWAHDVPLTNTGLSYRRHRANLDAGLTWRLTNHLSFSANARNLHEQSLHQHAQWVAPSAPVRHAQRDHRGLVDVCH
jgi:outer membrane receptor protein involved in Fe transport